MIMINTIACPLTCAYRLVFPFIFLLLTAHTGRSQGIGFERGTRVIADFKKGRFQPYSIPFDVAFVIAGPIAKEIKKVNLIITQKKKCGTTEVQPAVSWERNTFNSSPDSTIPDSFYLFVSPLQAIQDYQFNFSFERAISKAESADLNQLVSLSVENQLKGIYSSSTQSTLTANLRSPNSPNIQALAREIGEIVVRYYDDKSIHIEQEPITKKILLYLPIFTGRYFFDVMADRISAKERMINSMNQVKDTYLPRINNMAFLQALLSVGDKLKLSTDEQNLLDSFCKKPEVLVNAVFACPSSDLNIETATLTATDLQPYLAAANTAVSKAASLVALFARINNDADIKKLVEAKTGVGNLAAYTQLTNDFHLAVEGIASQVSDYIDKTKAYEAAFTNARFDFRTSFPLSFPLPGASTAEFVTRGEWYITADLGMAYVLLNPNNAVRPYLGVNFNFFPINRQANYSLVKSIGKGDYRYILKGLSAVIGLTVTSFGNKDPYSDVFGNISLLTGLGIRITDGVRFSYGRFWLYEKDPNELLNRKKLTTAPYFSLSLDWDLRNWLKNFRKQVPGFAD